MRGILVDIYGAKARDSRRLVKGRSLRIEFVLGISPVLALGPHVRPLLLSGIDRVSYV